MRIRALLVLLVVVGLCSGRTAAAADSWMPGSLNPLAKSKNKNVSVNKSTKKPSMAKSAGKTLSSITQAPSDLFAKSKSILPGGHKPAKPPSHSRQVSSVKKKEEKPSFLKSMFVSEPPPPPPRTVGEWMALKRINP